MQGAVAPDRYKSAPDALPQSRNNFLLEISVGFGISGKIGKWD
jgi:hypothetical protein